MTSLRSVIVVLFVAAPAPAQVVESPEGTVDWPAYLGGRDSSQYSALDLITRQNVGRLEKAWEYRTGDAADNNLSQIQCNPLIIDGVLYGTSPGLKIFALDAATGAEKWVFDPFSEGSPAFGVNRGLMSWEDGGERRLLAPAMTYVYALDPETGRPIDSFGNGGRIDLRKDLDHDATKLSVAATTPGVVFEDLMIIGCRVSESHPSAPGHIRAYDVRTGERRWIFHTIPHPGEFGYETWPPDAWESTGGANAWAGMSLDPDRAIVYVPTGSAAYDFYGADRWGANLFANCLLALNARTGERAWHFQTVHHDVWDRDLPAPPNLVTLTRNGQRVDAVAQITKSAHVFVFDRATGEPLFPVDEVPVPASDLEGEKLWPTQPVPRKPPAFGRQTMTEADLTNVSPEIHEQAMERFRRLRSGGPFVPPSREGTVIFPGFDGGGEWGGAAVDPATGILYVNGSEMPWILTMVDVAGPPGTMMARRLYAQHCLYCHGLEGAGDPLKVFPPLRGMKEKYTKSGLAEYLRRGQGRMPSYEFLSDGEMKALVKYIWADGRPEASEFADENHELTERGHWYYSTGYNRFVDAEGRAAVKPPWGTMTAIDLNAGEILWQVPLGEHESLTERGMPHTGTEQYGGPIVTASGLIFVAATTDAKLRALDTRDGRELWQTDLPAAGFATPATYAVDGRQYVVIACGGGKIRVPSGDSYVAFALPSALE